MLLEDDEKVHFTVGDVFLMDSNEHVQESVDTAKEEIQNDIVEAAAEIETITAKLDQLKATLYAKFGKTINLEESPSD